MSADRRSSGSPSNIVDAFAGDVAARLLPVAGFGKIHAALLPKLLKLSRLERQVYDVLLVRHDGWHGKERPRTRTEDLCALLGVTRRRVLLAIAELVRRGLVRRLTPGQGSVSGGQFEIVQPGENKAGSDRPAITSQREEWKPGDHISRRRSDPPVSIRASDTLLSSRSDQPVPSPLLEISSTPSLPPDDEGGGEAMKVPQSWVQIARRLFPRCHSPEKFLVQLAEHSFSEADGIAYLEKAAKARDLPPDDHRALAVWCSAGRRRAEWRDRRRRQELRLVRTGPPEAVDVVVLTPAQLVERARAALNTFSTPEPGRGDTGPAKIDSGRSSPEQTANLGGTLDVAEGGSR